MRLEELEIKAEILKALKRIGFTEPTPIQEKCIPEIKAGKNVVAQSLTGSGKTAAFGVPILEKIVPEKGLQMLVLTPTRELAAQVGEMLANFAFFMKINITTVYGGVGIEPQISALRRAHIVVATPGRMLDHIGRDTINLKNIQFLVLDEADKMFEMGFIEDVTEIIRCLPKQRQTLLFSATIPQEVHQLVKRFISNPVIIKEKLHVDKSLLRQVYYDVKHQDKFSLLIHLLKHKTPDLAIVFCGTRREVDAVAKNLKMQKIRAMAVHGGLSQNKRSFAVDSLKKENINVLVATDVAARGLDINRVSHVYNYDSPKTPNEYTHRIGRTARAGKYGEAVTLLSDRDHENFGNVMSDRSLNIQKEKLPQFERIKFDRAMQQRGGRDFRRETGQSRGYRGRDERYGRDRESMPSRRFDSRNEGRRPQNSRARSPRDNHRT
ncbi:MAG: DEAD/DEAH box helicase [Candidatus Woesearchaeota archaeon]